MEREIAFRKVKLHQFYQGWMLWFESKLVKLPLKINNFSNFRGKLSVGSSGRKLVF